MITHYTAIAIGLLCALIYSGLLIATTMRSSSVNSLTARLAGSFIRMGIILYAFVYILRSSLNHLILVVGVFFVTVWVIMIAYKHMRT